jgi:hypothetical protein
MKLLIDGKEYEYCPQHGYSLPCDKCGLGQYELGKQAGIKEVVEWVDKWREVVEHGDYSNGNEAFGVDEGRVLTYQHIENLDKQWQSKLKEWGI